MDIENPTEFQAAALFLNGYPDPAVVSAFRTVAHQAINDVLEVRNLAVEAIEEADQNALGLVLELAATKMTVRSLERQVEALEAERVNEV